MPDEPILADRVRAAARAHPDIAAPAAIAEIVMDAIPPGSERALLAALMPRYVADVLRRIENTPASAAESTGTRDETWAGMLRERVPTEAGYRFLGDCTPADIRAGADRRRETAKNYDRRAEVYDALAAALEANHVPTVGNLPVAQVPDVVYTERGYQPAGGVERLIETHPAIAPTVQQLAAELAALPVDTLITTLLRDPEVLEKAALADLRGVGDDQLAVSLRSETVANAWYLALQRIQTRLQSASKYRRIENHGSHTRSSAALRDDAARMSAQIAQARRVVVEHRQAAVRAAHRPAVTHDYKTKRARRELRHVYQEEFRELQAALQRSAGIPAERMYAVPAIENAWLYAVEHDLMRVDPRETQLRDLTDDEFIALVKADVNATSTGRARDAEPIEALRLPGVLDRWYETLKGLRADVEGQPPAEDPLAHTRRGVYLQTVQSRHGECSGLIKARQALLAGMIADLNCAEARSRCAEQATDTLVCRYPSEYERFRGEAPADERESTQRARAARRAASSTSG